MIKAVNIQYKKAMRLADHFQSMMEKTKLQLSMTKLNNSISLFSIIESTECALSNIS